MSRHLRFRAWDKRDGKMVTGKHPCNLSGEVFFLYGFGAMTPKDRNTLDCVNDIEF